MKSRKYIIFGIVSKMDRQWMVYICREDKDGKIEGWRYDQQLDQLSFVDRERLKAISIGLINKVEIEQCQNDGLSIRSQMEVGKKTDCKGKQNRIDRQMKIIYMLMMVQLIGLGVVVYQCWNRNGYRDGQIERQVQVGSGRMLSQQIDSQRWCEVDRDDLEGQYRQVRDRQIWQGEVIKRFSGYSQAVYEVEKQLQDQKEYVFMHSFSDLDQHRKQIINYQQQNKGYKILIYWNLRGGSVEQKLEQMGMINQLGVDSKVAMIMFGVGGDNNSYSEDIFKIIGDRYVSLSSIFVDDLNDEVDSFVHDHIKGLVKQSIVLQFGLYYKKGKQLFSSGDGVELLKDYNRLVEQQQYLEWLRYINSWSDRIAETRKEIDRLIERVRNI